eukprot:scaffold86084_cov58-Phaeocystis_antarctica.AAC.3
MEKEAKALTLILAILIAIRKHSPMITIVRQTWSGLRLGLGLGLGLGSCAESHDANREAHSNEHEDAVGSRLRAWQALAVLLEGTEAL